MTLLWLAPDTFTAYELLTSAVFNANTQTGLLQITPAQFDSLQSLFFTISSICRFVTSHLPKWCFSQVWPWALNSAIGRQDDVLYRVVANLMTTSGFINSQVFFERFYSVFDFATHCVGLVNTPYVFA
ncbi:hypothetical protein B0H10DRAFT_1779448 [Mycena sp. CBHHK59/15]|nr:hypothetical protein B0H10DRAFT_1779448 [Mycena sp. CBHHK59/15]